MKSMEEKSKVVAELLKVLANENRLLILCALTDGPLNVTEISKYVPNITQSSLSQHLSLLKANNILEYEKKGQNVTYFLKDERVVEILNTIQKYYC